MGNQKEPTKLNPKRHTLNPNGGFGLVEITIAVFIISVTLLSVYQLAIFALQKIQENENDAKALFLAKESVEAVRVLKDKSWTNNIANLSFGGDYHPIISSNSWSLTSGAETIDVFTRKVVIDNVSRDPATKDIEQSYSGTSDVNTKKVTATVSWSGKSIFLTAYVTNILGN